MEIHRATPPPYTAGAVDLGRPPAPPDDLIRMRAQADITLPDLKTVLSPDFEQRSPRQGSLGAHGSPGSIRSLPRIEARPHGNGMRRSVDTIVSPSEAGSHVGTDDSGTMSAGTMTAEETKMREAAEALAGLGNPDFARSPNASFHMPSHADSNTGARSQDPRQDQEPLLDLLTQAHPWVGGTISGGLSAYSTTKSFTPRFVQASANIMERNIATPVVSTVGSVGRMTGVEGVARWYLTPRGSREVEGEEHYTGRSKRRRVMAEEMDVESGLGSPRSTTRRESEDSRTESLPVYRASKPPSYREEESPATAERSHTRDRPSHNRTWSQQIALHASGLGVAMSERSRQTLIYCLSFLQRSTEHIRTVATALKYVLEQYDQARDHFHQNRDTSMEKGEQRPRTPDHDDAARRLAEIIKKHCDDIWATLKHVVHSISNSVGGALPSNARNFVRNQLLSLPARWQLVSSSQSGDSETSRNAHRMIAFASEGLDMIAHVSAACQATLDSAEGWVQVVGRRRVADENEASEHPAYRDEDHEMTNGEESQQGRYASEEQ